MPTSHLALAVSVTALVATLSVGRSTSPAAAHSVGAPHTVTVLQGVTRWPAHSRVVLRGPIVVAAGANLDIGPGVIVEADAGSSIVVGRSGTMSVRGTALEPVVLTCADGEARVGCWGGLVILGNAPINHGTSDSPAGGRAGSGGCLQSTLEGEAYGGCSPDDSSGVMSYVRVQYATHGLRTYGVGRKTLFTNIQVHRSQGTGLDVGGGTAQFTRLALTTNAQYGLVYSGGWTGQAQFVVIQQDATGYAGGLLGRNAVGAGGNPNATPRSAPTLANLTIVAPPGELSNPYGLASPAALRFDRGAAGHLYNVVLIEPGIGVDVDDAATCAQVATGTLDLRGLVLTAPLNASDPDADDPACAASGEGALLSGGTTIAGVSATRQFESATNVVLPDLRPVAGSTIASAVGIAPPAGGVLQSVTYLGAVSPSSGAPGAAAIPWYSGWTLGEQLDPPAVIAMTGAVSAAGRGGIAGIVVSVAPSGASAATDAAGRFRVSVPAGPIEVSVVSGVPTGCAVPPVVRGIASAGSTSIADVPLICDPPSAPALLPSSIVAGSAHSCALARDGAAYCWGYNSTGELGDGATLVKYVPVPVSGGLTFVSLASKFQRTCGISTSGATYCWGSNFTSSSGSVPTEVPGGVAFAQVAMGEGHTCGVTSAGNAYCWGGNDAGQLGIGLLYVGASSPRAVAGGLTFVAVAAGQNHSCGLTSAGTAFCWGANEHGQLGNGDGANQASPVQVSGALVFTTLVAGYAHTCGVTRERVAYCWGDNTSAQLGAAVGASSAVPVPVTGGVAFTTLSASWKHTCGITGTGATYCWGSNEFGQLGDGASVPMSTAPVRVYGSATFTGVATGSVHTCGIAPNGSAACWGGNYTGQLGTGLPTIGVPTVVAPSLRFTSVTNSSNVTCGLASARTYCWGNFQRSPTQVAGAPAFTKITRASATCGLTATGAAYCWGDNSSGQLGDGTTVTRSEPAAVTGGLTFTSLSAGGSHVCGLTASGTTHCWGSNAEGELGDGTTTNRSVPVATVTDQAFLEIATGSRHSCGRTAQGDVYCWGSNGSGQLGDSTRANRLTPVKVRGGLSFRSLRAAAGSTCAVASTGIGYCWGGNVTTSMGDGVFRNVPTRISTTYLFSTIFPGSGTSCALTQDGSASCWGRNDVGQAGNPSRSPLTTPNPVSTALKFTSLAIGDAHTCGISLSQSMYCWGDDSENQLGVSGIPFTVVGGITYRVP